jgi:hypothetical protein
VATTAVTLAMVARRALLASRVQRTGVVPHARRMGIHLRRAHDDGRAAELLARTTMHAYSSRPARASRCTCVHRCRTSGSRSGTVL